MHEPEIYQGHNTKNPEHWHWLQQKHFKPIYMQEIDPLVPDSQRYPIEDAQALAGVQMFPTTFAYMAALAILQGYEEIRIFGIELSASEYEYQANGYLFWFGFLRGRLGSQNVDSAVLYLDKNIFTVPLYGYEGNHALGVEYFQQRAALLDAEWQSSEKNAKNIRKAINKAMENQEYEKVKTLSLDFQSAMLRSGENAGALSEAERYTSFGDRYADRGGFEFAAASAQKEGEAIKPYIWHYNGQLEYVWNIWRQNGGKVGMDQVIHFVDLMGHAAYETGARFGAYTENIGYILKYDEIFWAGGAVLLNPQRLEAVHP